MPSLVDRELLSNPDKVVADKPRDLKGSKVIALTGPMVDQATTAIKKSARLGQGRTVIAQEANFSGLVSAVLEAKGCESVTYIVIDDSGALAIQSLTEVCTENVGNILNPPTGTYVLPTLEY